MIPQHGHLVSGPFGPSKDEPNSLGRFLDARHDREFFHEVGYANDGGRSPGTLREFAIVESAIYDELDDFNVSTASSDEIGRACFIAYSWSHERRPHTLSTISQAFDPMDHTAQDFDPVAQRIFSEVSDRYGVDYLAAVTEVGGARAAGRVSAEVERVRADPHSPGVVEQQPAMDNPALVDSLIRAQAGTDGINESEREAALGAIENASRLHTLAGVPRRRAGRIAARLETTPESVPTATQNAARLYQDGEDRYAVQQRHER